MFRYFLAAVALAVACSSNAQTFFVNASGDDNDPMDELLTLREALASANASLGKDTIYLPAGIQIKTDLGYTITDDVSIIGVEGAEAQLTSTAENLFEVENSEVSVEFENLSLTGIRTAANGLVNGIRACGNVAITNIYATGFFGAIRLCRTDLDLTVSQAVFQDNELFLNAFGGLLPESNIFVSIERSFIENSSLSVNSRSADVNLEIRESVYVAEQSYWSIRGGVSLLIRDSALLLSETGPLLSARYDSYDSVRYFPELDIIQSTIAGNQSDSPVLDVEGGTVRIVHSTFADNSNSNGNLLKFKSYTPVYGVAEGPASVEIDHSIIDRFYSESIPIKLEGFDLEARYSFIPAIKKTYGTETVTLDATSSLYQGAPAYLGNLVVNLAHVPHYLPQQGSPVVDAGDPSFVAGVGAIPELEQRKSSRVLGAAIDIGSTEYNNEPFVDLEALKAAYNEQVAMLADPDDDVLLDLDNFVSDPDGHMITDIQFGSFANLGFDPDTHVLGGHKSDFKAEPMLFLVEDETGLVGLNEADWRAKPKSEASGSGGGGGGGSLPWSLLASLIILGGIRKVSRQAE